jgi:hypothetical protein
MRIETWPDRLLAEIERHGAMLFQYGESDCLTFAMDCVKVMTGYDPMEGARDYTTIEGAYKRLKQRGYDNIGDALADKFEEIPTSMAQRGDVGVILGDGFQVAVVFVGPHAVGKDEPFGVKSVSRSLVERAFRVP